MPAVELLRIEGGLRKLKSPLSLTKIGSNFQTKTAHGLWAVYLFKFKLIYDIIRIEFIIKNYE